MQFYHLHTMAPMLMLLAVDMVKNFINNNYFIIL
jgi:hypothetical protein